jgi:hypothetical protein
MAQYNFDSSGVPDQTFDLVPAGWYVAEIVESEIKQTKAGDGAYINFQWKLLGPSHAGRTVWEMVMIQHPNQEVVDIGQQKLASVTRATGRRAFRDTGELHHHPVEIKVAVEKGKDGFDDKNAVKACRTLPGQGGGQGFPSQAPWQTPQQPAQGRPQAGPGYGQPHQGYQQQAGPPAQRLQAPPPVDDDLPF